MKRTAVLAVLALLLGAFASFMILFAGRFLWVAYQHGGIW